MKQSLLHRLIDVLVQVSSSLGLNVELCRLEEMAVMVHRIMSYQGRQFHTLEHVFSFLDHADGVTTLAAIFHDLVYLQVDGGLPADAVTLLSPYVGPSKAGFSFNTPAIQNDRAFQLCCALFGRDPEKPEIPAGAMNEFLSALLMYRTLQDCVPPPVLLAVAVCVEASIPFRGPNSEGRSMAEVLDYRLQGMVDRGLITTSQEDREAMVHRAVAFANVDVQDFCLDDAAAFLSNTWKLLPETNFPLRIGGAFTAREYRIALLNMYGFFHSLRPENIYHQYRGEPDSATMDELTEKAHRNLNYALQYLRAKLVAVGVIEAIAELSGGDAPLALFLGDIPLNGEETESLWDHLAPSKPVEFLDENHPVLRLLRDGRVERSPFDLQNSPLALWLYRGLKSAQWARLNSLSSDYFTGKRTPADLLLALPEAQRRDLLSACAEMVPTRRDRLKNLMDPRSIENP